MTFPTNILLDLHQDGLRVRIDTDRAGEIVQLTSTYADRCYIPFTQFARVHDALADRHSVSAPGLYAGLQSDEFVVCTYVSDAERTDFHVCHIPAHHQELLLTWFQIVSRLLQTERRESASA